MKLFFVLLLLIINTVFATSSFPKNYETILNCPAHKGSPTFLIARDQKNNFFLLFETKAKSEIIKLSIVSGDMGYSTLTFAKPNKELKKWVGYIYIYNNEEDISNPKKAIITGGSITRNGSVSENDQRCRAIGKPKLNL